MKRSTLRLATRLREVYPLGGCVEDRECAGHPHDEQDDAAKPLAIAKRPVEARRAESRRERHDRSRYHEVAAVGLGGGLVCREAADTGRCGTQDQRSDADEKEDVDRHRKSPDA